jgi:hypothetical protein
VSKQQEILAEFASDRGMVIMPPAALDALAIELGGQEAADTFLQECSDRHDKPAISNFRQPDGSWQVGGYFPTIWSDERIVDKVAELKGIARQLGGSVSDDGVE